MIHSITEKDLLYVKKIVSKVYKVSEANAIYADMISVGNEALMKAVKNFDSSRGTSIRTLIYKYVVFAVSQLLRKNYAKEFYTHKEDISILKDTSTSYSLDFLEHREATAFAVATIREFPQTEVDIFTAWLLGMPRAEVLHTHKVSKSEFHRVITKILDRVSECSQT